MNFVAFCLDTCEVLLKHMLLKKIYLQFRSGRITFESPNNENLQIMNFVSAVVIGTGVSNGSRNSIQVYYDHIRLLPFLQYFSVVEEISVCKRLQDTPAKF